MTFFTHCVALGVHPRLKSRHVAWHPSAVRRLGRIYQGPLRDLYVTGAAAAFVASRTVGGHMDEGAAFGDVQLVASSHCGVLAELGADGMWGEGLSGGRWDREGEGGKGSWGRL